ncbi:MAG: glycosyl hydrolase family 18 protein [Ilumatobacteraceae bacterium]
MAELGSRLRALRIRNRPVRRAALLVVFGLIAGATSAITTVVATPSPGPVAADTVVDVMAWSPYWEFNDALASFNANSSQMGELTPFFWTATGASTVVRNADINTTELQSYKTAAISSGKPFVATIVDGMPAKAMAAVLADPVARGAHVAALVQFAVNGEFAGIDIDYEKFAFSDGRTTWPATFDAWGAFMAELGPALDAAGKTLAVAVPPIYNSNRDPNSGYWVYNYPEMAKYVDRVRVMTYSYSTSSAGPIGPYNWVSASMDAALAVVPASKLVMGIAAYGNDWITKIDGACPAGVNPAKKTLTTESANAWALSKGVRPSWDSITRERTFSYVDSFEGKDSNGNFVRCNVSRTGWFADADTIYERVLLAQKKNLVGVALWAAGYDDSITWAGIAAARSGNTTWKAPVIADPTPRSTPGAPITSPTTPLPARFLDTRSGTSTIDGQFRGTGQLKAQSQIELKIAGRGTVPVDATAVTLNVTVIGAGNGFVTVYPCGNRPTTSNLNVRSGQVISNSVITRLSDTGTVCIYTQAPANLVVDVFNVMSESAFDPTASPARLLETRPNLPTIDGLAAGGGPLKPGTVLRLQVAGRGDVSADARAAVLNVTADGATLPGYITTWPCDSPAPATSNVNFPAHSPIANAVVTGLGPDGSVCISASTATNVIVDAFGELPLASYQPLTTPGRILDTRVGGRTVDGDFSGGGIMTNGSRIELQVTGRAGIPSGASSVVLNVTVDGPLLPGFITVYPCEVARPLVSNVNYAAGQTLPNLVITELSAKGTVCLFNSSSTHIVVDVFGELS